MKNWVLLQEGKLVFGTLLKQNDKQRTANIGRMAEETSHQSKMVELIFNFQHCID